MENEILIALLTKLVDEKVSELPILSGPRGPRGFPGPPGEDGKDFVFSDYEPIIRDWAKEFALKFEDLTPEQIAILRGPKGRDGNDGRDGKDFVFSEHEELIRQIISDVSLKFEDLTAEQIELLRGPKGRDGNDGRDGKDFIFSEFREQISEIIKSTVEEMSDDLKIKFEELSNDDIERIRGPRGRDGRDGRDFIFDEHREYFESLRLKFTDLSPEEVESLKLHFSQLTEEEKSSLKLKFSDLTDEDRLLIRGARGPRGQRGAPGRDGATGPMGPRGRPGPVGVRGLPGERGLDGANGQDGSHGKDAPHIVGIDIDQFDNEIVFIFEFSDGSVIRSDRVELPEPVNVYGGGAGVRRKPMIYETRIDEVSDDLTYVGKTKPSNTVSDATWQIQRITVDGTETIVEFADADTNFDNVWDDRAGLSYG